MKFIVSSHELSSGLADVAKVIPSKSVYPMLENLLFTIQDDILIVKASDNEITLTAEIKLNEVIEAGSVAVPGKLIVDSLKNFHDIPIQISSNEENNTLTIKWVNGESAIPFLSAADYPELPKTEGDMNNIILEASQLSNGINSTIFATTDDELRPIMNGIFIENTPDGTSFAATDTHKLSCYTINDIVCEEDKKSSFILHKKAASILKSLLVKSSNKVDVSFDEKNARFTFDKFTLVCRHIEGNFPAFRSIIPKNNPNRLVIDRSKLLETVKRITPFANQATQHIKLSMSFNQLVVSTIDVNSITYAKESLVTMMARLQK